MEVQEDTFKAGALMLAGFVMYAVGVLTFDPMTLSGVTGTTSPDFGPFRTVGGILIIAGMLTLLLSRLGE